MRSRLRKPTQQAKLRVHTFYQEQAGRPYRPSNGTEGEIFMDNMCRYCTKFVGSPKDCDILCRTFWWDIGDPQYPTEWKYADDGCGPTCTAFEAKP